MPFAVQFCSSVQFDLCDLYKEEYLKKNIDLLLRIWEVLRSKPYLDIMYIKRSNYLHFYYVFSKILHIQYFKIT